MSKLKRWFSIGCKGAINDSPSLTTLPKLIETLEMLERKECVLQNKISIENQRFKDLSKFKNKTSAVQCMKRKQFYESQVQQLDNFRMQIHDKMRRLKDAAGLPDL